jgi:hypothetical protein
MLRQQSDARDRLGDSVISLTELPAEPWQRRVFVRWWAGLRMSVRRRVFYRCRSRGRVSRRSRRVGVVDHPADAIPVKRDTPIRAPRHVRHRGTLRASR